MPRSETTRADETEGAIALAKKSLLRHALVELDLDLAGHRARAQAEAQAAAEAYAAAGHGRSAATLGESLALAGVGNGLRAAEAEWVVLVNAADEGDFVPATPALAAPSHDQPAPDQAPRPNRPRKSNSV